MDDKTRSLIDECERQRENCEYTSTSLYIWQKKARFWRGLFLVAPIVLGGIASTQILGSFVPYSWANTVAALLSVLAGFFPAIYVSLNLDMRVAEISRAAGEFTNLRDRFRQAGRIKSHTSFEEFLAQFETLMDRMDAARQSAPPVPDRCFREAQEKIKAGHYSHDFDEKNDKK